MKRRFTEDHYRKEPWFGQLVDALLACKGQEAMANFLRDIATLSELQALSERLEVARMLAQGLSYREISKKTGASTTTVTRVAQFLENGSGGYRAILGAHRHHRLIKKGTSPSVSPQVSPHQSIQIAKEPKPQGPLQKYLGKQ